MRSRVTLNKRKKTNGWRLPRGQYYRTIEYALGYWESINSTLTSCSWLKNNKVLAPFGKKLLWHHTATLSQHTSKVGNMVLWLKQFADHRGKRKCFCTHLSYIQEEFVDIYLGCGLFELSNLLYILWTEKLFIGFCVWKQVHTSQINDRTFECIQFGTPRCLCFWCAGRLYCWQNSWWSYYQVQLVIA